MECGGKRSATPLWSQRAGLDQRKRRRRFALPAHSRWWHIQDTLPDLTSALGQRSCQRQFLLLLYIQAYRDVFGFTGSKWIGPAIEVEKA